MQLAQRVKRQLEADSFFLTSMLSQHGKVDATVVLEEEPEKVLITLLMKDSEVKEAVEQAVGEFFGSNYSVDKVLLNNGRKFIIFTIVRNC